MSSSPAAATTPASAYDGHPKRWAILGVLVFSLLIVVLDNTVLNVALRSIQEELGASQAELEWAVNSYTLVFAGLLFTWGVLGDRYGRRRMLAIGMVLFGLSSVLCAFAQTPGELIAYRAIMGIGGAAVLPATLAIVTNVFPPAERGRAIGMWAGATGIGVALGPIVGGLLLEHFWWGSVFLVNVPIVIIALVGIVAIVPESRDPNPGHIDPLGVLLSVVGVTALVYGIIRGGQLNDWWSLEVMGSIVGGVVLLALFVLVERRSDHPSFDVRLFKDPRFSASTGAITLAFFALFGATFFLSFYLQLIKDYSPLQAGVRLLPVALGLLIFAPLSEKFVKRIGVRFTVASGLSLVTASFIGMQWIEADSPYWHLGILQLMLGIGMGLTAAPATNAVMSSLPREKAGAGSAVNNSLRQVGGALGVAVLGSVLSAVYRSEITPALSELPADVQHDAGESLGNTLILAVSTGRADLIEPAREAFVNALHAATLFSAATAFCGVLVALIWLPRRHEVLVDQAHSSSAPVELV
jgi:EmrB/QacA subfamily drug resistance transporter